MCIIAMVIADVPKSNYCNFFLFALSSILSLFFIYLFFFESRCSSMFLRMEYYMTFFEFFHYILTLAVWYYPHFCYVLLNTIHCSTFESTNKLVFSVFLSIPFPMKPQNQFAAYYVLVYLSEKILRYEVILWLSGFSDIDFILNIWYHFKIKRYQL